MNVKKMRYRTREEKLGIVSRRFGRYFGESVLDVGCDKKSLKAISNNYVGVDIYGQPDVMADAEQRLPFSSLSFDTVLAMDVLEHIDNIHIAFDELCRLSRKNVIIGLPNMYEWNYRLRFLFGKTVSPKYQLTPEEPLDRHRWLFSLGEAREFISERGKKSGFQITDEEIVYYDYQRLIAKLFTNVGKTIHPIGNSLFSFLYMAVLEKK